MAQDPVPVATLIASGQINRVAPSINALKLFPDYSKVYAAALPDMTPFLRTVKLPDLSGVISASRLAVPDFSKFYASLETQRIINDTVRAITAPQLAQFSKAISSMVLKNAMPDYSRLFAGLDSAALTRDYAAAMPAATKAAETFIVEEVLPEVEDSPSDDAVETRLKRLSPEARKRVLPQVEKAIIAVLSVTGFATQQGAVIVAGPGLALASAFVVLWIILRGSDRAED